MGKVVVVGSFNVDHVWTVAALPQPGETLSGRYRSGPGGKGFNQATAAARAGADTGFVCALGDDVGGQLVRTLAGADGIDLRAWTSAEPTGTAGIYVDADGRNCIVIGAGANATLTAAFVDQQASAIAAAAVVLCQLESPFDAVRAAFVQARHAGATTMLNPAPADAIAPAELLSLADVITPNETEFCAQLARHQGEQLAADTLAALDDAQLHAACRHLLPRGTVVITLGAAGCVVSHADDGLRGDMLPFYRVEAARVHAVDTTGAGDAFNGALAASLADAPPGWPFVDHVRFASRYAALSTERAGASAAMPLRDEVLARFAG